MKTYNILGEVNIRLGDSSVTVVKVIRENISQEDIDLLKAGLAKAKKLRENDDWDDIYNDSGFQYYNYMELITKFDSIVGVIETFEV